ncbi:hypothetical protein [Pseudomonas amygdali]
MKLPLQFNDLVALCTCNRPLLSLLTYVFDPLDFANPYNNKLHDESGTRNEYHITYMTKYFREIGAQEGEALEISKSDV